jgi:hypothetical protein
MSQAKRRMSIAAVVAVAFACFLAAAMIGAFHQLSPHGMPVAVVAPAGATTQIQDELRTHLPGAIALKTYPSVGAAATAIRGRDVDGAFVLGDRSLTLLSAGADGTATSSFLTTAASSIAGAAQLSMSVHDLVPLPASDNRGLALFFAMLSTLMPGIMLGAATTLIGRGAPARFHAAVLVLGTIVLGLGTIVLGLGVTLLVGPVIGAVSGHFLGLWGLTALLALALAASTAGLTRLKPAGAAIAVLLFLLLGLPASGGPLGATRFVPGLWRALTPILPTSRGLQALTGTVYFGNHGVATCAWLLAAWAAGGLALVLGEGLWRHGPQLDQASAAARA